MRARRGALWLKGPGPQVRGQVSRHFAMRDGRRTVTRMYLPRSNALRVSHRTWTGPRTRRVCWGPSRRHGRAVSEAAVAGTAAKRAPRHLENYLEGVLRFYDVPEVLKGALHESSFSGTFCSGGVPSLRPVMDAHSAPASAVHERAWHLWLGVGPARRPFFNTLQAWKHPLDRHHCRRRALTSISWAPTRRQDEGTMVMPLTKSLP